MKTISICMLAIAATSACTDQTSETGTYRSSESVRVKLLTYAPRHMYSTGMAAGELNARVTTIRSGTDPYEVELPESCPEQPIRAHLGSDVMMRQDTFVRADGSRYGVVTEDEMVAALCGNIEARKAPPLTGDVGMSSPLPM